MVARHSTGFAAGSAADRVMTTISSLTTKHERMPMPNWPMKSVGRAPSAAFLELSPMVARNLWTSSAVSPTPLSVNTTAGGLPFGAWHSTSTSPRKAGSIRPRAVIASTAFWSSSRTYTSGPL